MVGNDVWIGSDAKILSGTKINDGSIIGANSIVTKDVPPYAIVAGNPAKIIRYRFNNEIIEKLLEIKWWNFKEEELIKVIPLLQSNDIKEFLLKYNK
ncbi:CatB-related O-acetyltransferase [Methanobrevibacter sp.]|uniref:CatB-related O-acetyltransferase n=1 Tax=Methanobrevibacter sp. TaxID=66852 RepID=UPI003FA5ED3B